MSARETSRVGDASSFFGARSSSFFVIVVVAVYAARLAASAGDLLQGDGWFNLLLGREILAHGLPREDALTALGLGRSWIDAQWLAHLAFHGLRELGGPRLVVTAHVLLLSGALALTLDAARLTGASPRRVALGGLIALLVLMPHRLVRAQSFGALALALVLWLIVADARRGRRRLWLALPVLVVWANLHGSVLVGAGLVGLAALASAARRTGRGRISRLLLAALVGLTVFVTPYGPAELVGYWVKMVGDPGPFTEWDRPTLGTAPIHLALAAATLALLAWRWRRLDARWVALLGVSVLLSLTGLRYGVLLGYAFATFGPSLLDAALPGDGHDPRLRVWPFALGGAALFAFALSHGLTTFGDTFDERYPPSVASQPFEGGLVFTSESHGDWLLDLRPDLRGRVLFGVRSELGDAEEWSAVQDVLAGSVGPGLAALEGRLARPIRHVVLDRDEWAAAERALARSPMWRARTATVGVAVFERR
ncbi:MAG: hypothetical protein KF901_25620 [Myxococcales bacterium]|nr:hypothetical protein [Myxococcales bacterium]